MPNSRILNPNRYKKISKKEKEKKDVIVKDISNNKNKKYNLNSKIYKTSNKTKYFSDNNSKYNITDEQNDEIKKKITKVWKTKIKKVLVITVGITFLIGVVKVANTFYSKFEENNNITGVFSGIFGIEQDNINLNYELKVATTDTTQNNLIIAELDRASNSYLLNYDLKTYKVNYDLIENIDILNDGKKYIITVKKNTNIDGFVRTAN